MFDRVGKKDPVTRGIEIAVHWIGFNIDVTFWSQHISFYLVGCIVVTSIRGLLLTLTKVRKKYIYNNSIIAYLFFSFLVYCVHAHTRHTYALIILYDILHHIV